MLRPETISFPSNGSEASGYLVRPEGGTGAGGARDPGVVGPRLRHQGDGRLVSRPPGSSRSRPTCTTASSPQHDEMDKAAQLMQAMPPDRAARDMSGAIDYLAGLDGVTGSGIGVVGFCMGGMLAFLIAASRPDKVDAAVPFYGFPQGDMEPDWAPHDCGRSAATWPSTTTSSVRRRRRRWRRSCGGWARTSTLTVHPGTGHAFMGPHNALGTLDEEPSAIWPQVVSFLHEQLD